MSIGSTSILWLSTAWQSFGLPLWTDKWLGRTLMHCSSKLAACSLLMAAILFSSIQMAMRITFWTGA